jgi:caffeoyl-CoA O-methyltransferase
VTGEARQTIVPKGGGIEHAYNSGVLGGGAGLMEALALYSEAHSVQEPANLAALREETLALYAQSPAAARMLCDPLQGRVLALLSTLSRARNVLELGAFTGYSALSLCQGLPGDPQAAERRVVTCEPDPAARAVAARHIALAGLEGRIELRADKAADVLAALRADEASPLLDIAFIDADKKQYVQYVRTLIGADDGRPLLADGALIIVDNTLWKGLVLSHHLPPHEKVHTCLG